MSINSTVRDTARVWLAADQRAVVIEVIDAKGSVPRESGTRMLVAPNAAIGTIGGGHLELQAITHARTMLQSGDPGPQQREVALGPTLGQCCGGVMTLRWHMLTPSLLAQWPAPSVRFELQLFGAGHVGCAIVRLLADIDCRVHWIDEREDQFPAEALPPHIQRVAAEPAQDEVARAGVGAFYLVMTHSHDLDLQITQAVMRRGDFGYLGLIGSATKRARFVHRLEQRGIAADQLERLVCPIGVPGVPGKEPAVIAVAVVAQLLQRSPG